MNALLGGNIDSLVTPKVKEKLHENEAKIKVLTEQWAGKIRLFSLDDRELMQSC